MFQTLIFHRPEKSVVMGSFMDTTDRYSNLFWNILTVIAAVVITALIWIVWAVYAWADFPSLKGQSYSVSCTDAGVLISAANPQRLKMSFFNLSGPASGITLSKGTGSFTAGEVRLASQQMAADSGVNTFLGAWRCYTATGETGTLLIGETSKP